MARSRYMTQRAPVKTAFKTFDSMDAALANPMRDNMSIFEHEWAGGRDLAESIAYVRRGADEHETKPARELISKIDASFRGRMQRQWVPQVAGAYPVVPDYINGDPECMRTMDEREHDRAPIRVVMMTNVACGVGHKTIIRRGAAMAALAMRLTEIRPTELYIGVAWHNRRANTDVGFKIRIDSAPINPAQVVACFNPSFARRVTFALCDELCHAYALDSYPFLLKGIDMYSKKDEALAVARDYLGLEPQDIFIMPGILTEVGKLDSDPVAWVHEQLEAQREVGDND